MVFAGDKLYLKIQFEAGHLNCHVHTIMVFFFFISISWSYKLSNEEDFQQWTKNSNLLLFRAECISEKKESILYVTKKNHTQKLYYITNVRFDDKQALCVVYSLKLYFEVSRMHYNDDAKVGPLCEKLLLFFVSYSVYHF